jgi:hypothetical protein
MKDKTVDIKNFIGVYDNYIPAEECDRVIKIFELSSKYKRTLNRKQFENVNQITKKDEQFFAGPENLDLWWDEVKNVIFNFDIAWHHYLNATGAQETYDDELIYGTIKIQKTLPTEGYHVWHIEHGKGFYLEPRAFVFSVYLNDVEEGGETEFLHFSKRVKPKKGRIVIWPAGFPYLHRGNPPLSGEKYILTSWMVLR